MASKSNSYPASLTIDYPKKLDRLTTFFRIFWAIPIITILLLLTGSGSETYTNQVENDTKTTGSEASLEEMQKKVEKDAEQELETSGLGLIGGLFAATALMILFRQRYPRWWFEFNLELQRFTTRVGSYLLLLTDRYPSTVDEQAIHLDITYPDAKKDLNRWLPLVKWLLAIPHYIVLLFLFIGLMFAVIVAWFAILFTGRYPQSFFNYVVGVLRWSVRVNAYAFLLTTDQYPPFSLK